MLIISAQLSDTGPITCVARNRSGEAVAQVQILKKCSSRNYYLILFVRLFNLFYRYIFILIATDNTCMNMKEA